MSESDQRADVLIVGAGPTGLTLAAQVHAFGASVRVVDRQKDRVRESRALAIQPRSLEVLRDLGVAQTLVERGNDTVRLVMHVDGHAVRIKLFDTGLSDTAFPYLLFVSQAETEAVLNEHLSARGVAVEREVELVDFKPGDEIVSCLLRFEDGRIEQVRAGYLAGCDGANSTVRRHAGIPFEGAAYPQTFALGDVEVDGDLEPATVHSFSGAGGMMFLFPLGKPATWRMIGMSAKAAAESEREKADLSLEELQSIADGYTGGRLRLRDPAWLTYFRLHHRHAASYRRGRVFLAGDAAHVHSPAGAQGMNTGIQDAWNLGWKLALVARGMADQSLLSSYEAERFPAGLFVLRFTDRLFAIASSSNPLVRVLRTRVVPRTAPAALRVGAARAFGFRTISQLGVHYRGSPAVSEGRPRLRRGPKAGDRLPDGEIVVDGRWSWLQEELDPAKLSLLLCGSLNDWGAVEPPAFLDRYGELVVVHRVSRAGGSNVLLDREGVVLTRLGGGGAMQYLVRPDGYIGYRCAGTDFSGLESYLADLLAGAPR